jgi:Tol biopolymer transport system component
MHLVSAAPDGSRLRDVTTEVPGYGDADPIFSPDGRRVLFTRACFEDCPSSVGVVSARGGPVKWLDLGCVDPCFTVDSATWTPDGRRVVFTSVIGPFDQVNGSARSAVLWTAKLDGSDVRRLSEPGIDGVYEDYRAHFGPGGKYIVFIRVRNSDVHSALFRMRPDGTDVRQLTPWELDADIFDVSPAVSGPTRDLVAFETFGHGWTDVPSRVATVPATCTSVADCTSKIRIVTKDVTLPNAAFNPTWSPDGKRIAYCSFIDNGPDAPPSGIIQTIRPDGTDVRQVSDGAFFAYRPDWGAPRDDD